MNADDQLLLTHSHSPANLQHFDGARKEGAPGHAASAGQHYEQTLASASPALRKASGVYYTPADMVAHVIRHTLGRVLEGQTPAQAARITVLDPACGCGSFLLGAVQYLMDWHRDWYMQDGPQRHTRTLCQDADGRWQLRPAEKRRLARQSIFGVDIDPHAVALARQALHELTDAADWDSNIRCGDALLSWQAEGLQPLALPSSFPVVVGNPPWGQKDIDKDEAMQRLLRQRYPSSVGIFDRFRPFVELGVRLTAAEGRFGMVLPDIVLLKDYPQTRLYLLDHLSLERIDNWGLAFAGAVIDAVTIVGSKRPAPADQSVTVTVGLPERTCTIPQADFRANPRHVFNLHLTPDRRRILDRLQACPRLGDDFEVHEGVHSGNMRVALFVDRPLDDSCRELLFGRDEIAPYALSWHGRYVRLSAVPTRKTRQRYANPGRPEWYARDKVLVRRTGDFILAAVDRQRRYASNNFFVVFPKRTTALDVDGLCALLNSHFMTWYFRTIEPRQGRVFAELKIKHLTTFPLPQSADGCRQLNELGRRRREEQGLDTAINERVRELFGVREVD